MGEAPQDVYAVIVAGGTGTRLWPLSRKKRPKQFLNIFDNHSFLETVHHRIQKFVPDDHIFIVAPDEYSNYLKKYLPDFPLENFMGEPEKKGTTAAYGYTATYIKQLNPNAILHIIAADDYIVDESQYVKALQRAQEIVTQEKSLVIYGVKPRDPNTGYGYVQVDLKSQKQNDGVSSFLVESFHEKPDLETAKKYLTAGDYFWHVFGFTITVPHLLSLIEQFDSPTAKVLSEVEQDMKLPSRLEAARLKEHYSHLHESNIDNQVLEKTKEPTYMVTLEESWSDVGTWDHVYAIKKKDESGNVIVGDKNSLYIVGTTDSLIIPGDKPLALVGLRDIVVIDAGDIMLICDKNKAQDVKKMVNLFKEKKLDQYL